MPKKKISITKVISIFSILFGLLIFLSITEHLERGEVNTLLVFLTIINGISGIVGGILLLKKLEQGRILLKYQAITGYLFTLFYATVNNEWRNPTILFFVAYTIILVVPRLKIVKNIIKNRTSYETNIQNLKFNNFVKIFFLLLFSLLTITWAIKWEEYLGLFHIPTGEGLSFYHTLEKSPQLQISTDGGYIFDVRESNPLKSQTEITFISNNPESEINIETYKNLDIKINLLNINQDSRFLLNDNEIIIERGPSSDIWEMNERDIIGYIQNHSYTDSTNDKWINISTKANEKYNISISPNEYKSDSFNFYIMSDLHSGYITYVPELNKIRDYNPDFLIVNGDIVNWGFPTEYMIYSMLSNTLPFPVYTTIGNHDIWNNGKEFYNKYLGPEYYSFEYKDTYFIFLDTSKGIVGSIQMDWLENQLEISKDINTLVFSHMSPVDTVTGSYDSTELVSEELSATMYSKAESEHILEIMDIYDVEAFVSGHSHIMDQSKIHDTLYISSGALGGSVNSGGHNIGYLKCTISNDEVIFSEIVVESNEDVSESFMQNSIDTLRVFGIPFLINKNLRIAISLVLLILADVIWFTVITNKGKEKEKRNDI